MQPPTEHQLHIFWGQIGPQSSIMSIICLIFLCFRARSTWQQAL